MLPVVLGTTVVSDVFLQVISGSVLSITSTLKVQVCALPAASVAVQVTFVTPYGKFWPLSVVSGATTAIVCVGSV